MIFHSWPFVPALAKSRLTLSFHRSFGLPFLLLPPASAFHALFDSLSSLILCTCPAHLILLPTTFILGVFSCQSLLSISSPSWVTLHILQTQLFSAICTFSCLSVSVRLPNPYIQAGTTQVSNTFPFSCFFSFISHIMPSTLLHAAAPACTLCISLLLPPFSHTVLPQLYKTVANAVNYIQQFLLGIFFIKWTLQPPTHTF